MTSLTRQQLCAALAISESTVRRLERDGLPCTPVGSRAKRYDLAECQKWLRNNQGQATPCQSGKTKTGAITSASWSTAAEYIASSAQQRRRVMPSALTLICGSS